MSVSPQPEQGASATEVDPGEDNRRALIRLVVFVIGGVGLAAATHALAVLVVILALIAMVMVHELGHFIAAKSSGMKVTEYFLGFGPRVWSVRRGETEYGVKAIPAGGYVRIVGMTTAEEIDPVDEPRSYREATFPRRLLVGVAGSAMHFVMAFLLLFALFAVSGAPVAAVAEVTALHHFATGPSPAEQAGFKAGDQFVSIDGKHFATAAQYVAFVQDHPGIVLHVVVRRDGRLVALNVRPVDGRHVVVAGSAPKSTLYPANSPPVGVIGVELEYLTRNETVNPLIALQRSGSMLASLTAATGTGIAQVFSLHGLGSFVHQVATANNSSNASGGGSSASSSNNGQFISIVGAVQIGAQAARQNISELLLILVAINLFIGMVNLFPMLPLDGGHVAIAIYERIRTRRRVRYHADVAKLMPLAYLFLACMVVIGLGALYLNVLHPATLPGG